ncbi:MAG: hypothetical protein ACXQS8_01660 [Candidatus Helarchaeales archaeon]
MSKKTKTIFFEKVFGVNIDSFKTTEEINKFIENRRNKKMKIIEIESPIVSKRGGIFRISNCDIEKMVKDALDV